VSDHSAVLNSQRKTMLHLKRKKKDRWSRHRRKGGGEGRANRQLVDTCPPGGNSRPEKKGRAVAQRGGGHGKSAGARLRIRRSLRLPSLVEGKKAARCARRPGSKKKRGNFFMTFVGGILPLTIPRRGQVTTGKEGTRIWKMFGTPRVVPNMRD